jgi:hypothetical protein
MIVIIRLILTVLRRGQGTVSITVSPRIIFFSVTLHTLTFSSNAFAWRTSGTRAEGSPRGIRIVKTSL